MNNFLRDISKLFLVTVILAVITSTIFAQVNVGEKILQVDFEEGGDSAGVPLVSVNYEGQPGYTDWKDNGTLVRIDSLIKHGGMYSATIYNPIDTLLLDCSMDIIVNQLEPGARYEMTVWVKTEVTEGNAILIAGWDGSHFEKITGSTDWTQYSVSFDGPPNTNESTLRYHISGKGKVWYDDIEVTKTRDPRPNELINPGFEDPDLEDPKQPDGWYTEIFSGHNEINTDSASLFWDNTEAHTGNYSAKFKQTAKDNDYGQFFNRWGTKTYHFTAGALYEISYWVKTENFHSGSRIECNLGYNNQNLTSIRENIDWTQVKDTILFPTDQETSGYRNMIRWQMVCSENEDTLSSAWIDDVQFKLLGVQAATLDSIVVKDNEDGSVDISWPDSDVESPVYHILMQPTAEMGRYENNILDNPGFETPSEDGSSPDGWSFYVDGWDAAQPAVSEYPADETYDGNFSVWMGEEDPVNEKGVYARWETTFDESKMLMHQTYLYGAMIKYTDVVTSNGKIANNNSPFDSVYTCGVNILYDRYSFYFQNEQLLKLGYQTPVGTSEGFVEVALPVNYAQGSPRHKIGIGLGQYWDGVAKGNIYIDNAFVVPFEEVATTSNNSITISDVPENVKYFAVWVEDSEGKKINSFSQLGVKNSIIMVDVQQIDNTPVNYSLSQNYPNPFNPSTTIEYSLSKTEKVKLEIFDILGRRVTTLVDEEQTSGSYKVTFDASQFASGVYFYKLRSGNFVKTKKMMVLK